MLYLSFVGVFDLFRDTEGIYILAWICSIFKHEHRLFTLTVKPYNYQKTSLHDDSTPVALLMLLFSNIKTLFPLNVALWQKECCDYPPSRYVPEENKHMFLVFAIQFSIKQIKASNCWICEIAYAGKIWHFLWQMTCYLLTINTGLQSLNTVTTHSISSNWLINIIP